MKKHNFGAGPGILPEIALKRSAEYILELNGTGKLNDKEYEEQWLQEGDVVEMEIKHLGKLRNILVAEESDFSILAKKKNIS